MSRLIEEDLCFVTDETIKGYTLNELIWKPHLSGYDFSQLIDQIAGQVIRSKSAGVPFKLMLTATGGTALWIAKHLEKCDHEVNLLIAVESKYSSPLLLSELSKFPFVTHATNYNRASIAYGHYPAKCIVVACKDENNDRILSHTLAPGNADSAVIVYDPGGQLVTTYGRLGHYFMGSSIWVRD